MENTNEPVLVKPPDTLMDKEPEFAWGAIIAVVAPLLGMLVAFGLPIDDGQVKAILALIGPLAAMFTALGIRPRVYSERSAQKVANLAAASGNATIAPPPAREAPETDIANGKLPKSVP